MILWFIGGIGVDCVIDVVGVDVMCVMYGLVVVDCDVVYVFDVEVDVIVLYCKLDGCNWVLGDGLL